MRSLQERLTHGQPIVAAGVMSGTSADGIDVALTRIGRGGGRLELESLGFRTVPYPAAIRDRLFRCFANEATPRELCLLHAALGELYADAVAAAVEATGAPVDYVACHGQTIWHEPEPVGAGEPAAWNRGTLQLGEAARIAVRLGVPVVSDFRQQDLALGGQGAPLVPYFDYLVFADPQESRALQNLGGIGNVAYLPAGGSPEDTIAFDTGPGNALMDAAASLATGGRLTCDLNGELAAGGPVNLRLLDELLREPYLHQAPPKSTGRELFSAARVQEWWDGGVQGAELVSTLTQFTVETVASAYRQWLGPIDRIIVGGGGANNPELMRRLGNALAPAVVTTSREFGVDSDAKEALAFAVLGYETLRGEPSNVPSATGASRPCVQGKITWP